MGIAFAAIYKGERTARGYAGAITKQPEMAMGTLSVLIHDILEDTRGETE
ncbi:hypothetical protein [Nitrosococcus wardiae]|nr:hypothetical protein [Nitrosococcus wardiae]